jgi:hypothetical protein
LRAGNSGGEIALSLPALRLAQSGLLGILGRIVDAAQ